jgi:hypothetical protein
LKVCEWTRCSDMGRPLRHDYITRLLLCTNFSSDIIKLAFLFVSIKQHVHVSEHHSCPSATLLLDPKTQTDHSADCGEEVADEDGVLSHGISTLPGAAFAQAGLCLLRCARPVDLSHQDPLWPARGPKSVATVHSQPSKLKFI